MRSVLRLAGLALAGGFLAFGAHAAERAVEDYERVPMPPGFRVEVTELEGRVFADANGRTLYMWPSKLLRNGYAGETKGKPGCYDERQTENAGLQSPYPSGLVLPDLETRPTCTDMWPPVYADMNAKPVGAWSIVERKDGTRQWAYNEYPLYTSHLDRQPGDTLGGTTMHARIRANAHPAVRIPVGPPPAVPPGFHVLTAATGRLVTTAEFATIYTHEKDTATRTTCDDVCAQVWKPVLAPATAEARGEWTLFERSSGVYQWAFRGKPVYTYSLDMEIIGMEGVDVPGWQVVYTQRTPDPPDFFSVRDNDTGQVLTDGKGRTIYLYVCADDATDQLACDHPDTTNAYRLALCGGGDAQACLKNWPLVPAPVGVKTGSRAWGTMWIAPLSGRRVEANTPGAMHVWTFRDRPIYTHAADTYEGDYDGDGRGEMASKRQGFKAFWLRDDYFRNAN